MIYLLGALALLLVVSILYLRFQNHHDIKRFGTQLALLLLLLIFSYSSKILLVYKPILLLHLALLMMAWWHYYHDMKKSENKPSFWIFSPLLSITLFIMISLFFRENG